MENKEKDTAKRLRAELSVRPIRRGRIVVYLSDEKLKDPIRAFEIFPQEILVTFPFGKQGRAFEIRLI